MTGKFELVALMAEAVHEAEKSGVVTRGTLLEALDKAPSSFANELNPWPDADRKNKLGLEDAFRVMMLIRDARVLTRMAADMGYALRDLADVCPDKATLAEELLDDLPPFAAFQAGMRERRPVEQVHTLLLALFRDLEEDFVAYRKEMAGETRRVA